jgi:hypothetical protein
MVTRAFAEVAAVAAGAAVITGAAAFAAAGAAVITGAAAFAAACAWIADAIHANAAAVPTNCANERGCGKRFDPERTQRANLKRDPKAMSNPNGPAAGQEHYRAYYTGKERPETNGTANRTIIRRKKTARTAPSRLTFPSPFPWESRNHD